MTSGFRRRDLLKVSCGAFCGAAAMSSHALAGAQTAESQPASAKRAKLKKAIGLDMVSESIPLADRFKVAADAGFDGVEVVTVDEDAKVEAMKAGAEKAGIRIHSVMNAGNWDRPLTSPNPAIAKKGLDCLRRSLQNAHAFGADTVLTIVGAVTPEVRYKDAWPLSQRQIREVLPLARQLKVIMALENVGNRFMLSPLEFVRYVDELNDPYVQAYFDIGNSLVLWGYPQDWILTLGPRIRKLHLKDFSKQKNRFVLPGDGDADWPAVCRTLNEIGYRGWVTAELHEGDAKYLQDVSRRMDKVFAGVGE